MKTAALLCLCSGKIKTMDRSKCVFCRIYDGQESNRVFFQDEEYVVFSDIKPAAQHHLLIVTKDHIPNIKAVTPDKKHIVERLMELGKQMLQEQGADLADARFGFHWPPFSTISHLHMHAISPASSMGFIGNQMFRENSWWFVSPEYVLKRLTPN